MNPHHIISEADQAHACPYCGKNTAIKRWKSVFDASNMHYKECVCSCGHRVTVKVDFMGSGHDSWNKNLRNLDKRIEEEEEE
jgi:DNA-directed RNA polymerase subunit RPC12/RpoP